MKIYYNDDNIGRWILHLQSSRSHEENETFKEWMDKNCSECMCIHRFNNGDPYWAIQGGDMNKRTLILLKWT